MPLLLKPAWPLRLDYLNRRTEAHSIRTRLAMCRSMGDPWRRDAVVCPALPCPVAKAGQVGSAFSSPLTDLSLRVLTGGAETQPPQLFLFFSTNFDLFLFGVFSSFFFLPFIWQGWPMVKAGLGYLWSATNVCILSTCMLRCSKRERETEREP
jgi:hypothetical protein